MVDPTAPRLKRADWLAVAFTAGLLLTLAYTTYVRRPGTLPEGGALRYLTPPKSLFVSISGCVAHPGDYTMGPESKLNDLLALAEPYPSADLSGLPARLRDGQKLVIPEKQCIRVWVEGAVAYPRYHTLPAGATLGDLLRQVELSEDAATYALKRRQRLEDRQIVTIPRRKRAKRLT